jgi:hypothetical protein
MALTLVHRPEAEDMAYTAADLDRRAELGRELLSTHVPSTLMPQLVDFRLSGPGRLLDIAFPVASKPTPSGDPVTDPAKPLPKSDVVVLTYTSDEAKALADVMTPGRFSSDWNHYTHKFADYLPQIRNGAPARQAGRLGSYWRTKVGKHQVLVMKSELHMHQDSHTVEGKPSLPIRQFFRQVAEEAKPSHFFCIGTAGGTYTNRPLGTIVLSRSAQFLCERTFKSEPFANRQFKSDWTPPTNLHETALKLMKPFSDNLVIASGGPLTTCPCHGLQGSTAPKAAFLRDGHDGIPAFHPVLTTDFFEFGTDQNKLGDKGVAVEMDDAAFGLACEDLGATAPKWASIRNYSDPAINGALPMKDQENCAANIYAKYGYWTSVQGALATWSVIAGL